MPAIFDPVGRNFSLCADTRATRTKRGLKRGGGRCRASMKMSPFLLDRNVSLLRPEDPIPSCDDCAACSGTRQDYPAARATTARGLDGTAASRNPIFLIRGNGNSWNPLHGPFLLR